MTKAPSFTRFLWATLTAAAALLPNACSGSDHGGGKDNAADAGTGGAGTGGTDTGTVTDPWRSYCIATFTKDYSVTDAWGEALFTARSGEQYLMMDYGEDRATLAYLTSAGPYDFEVTAPSGTRDFPFTTDCAFGASTPYYAVFADVSVYSAADLATSICELKAGAVKPRDGATMAGYSAASLGLTGSDVYEVYLNAFSADCGGAESGFVSTPPVEVLGSTTNIVPIVGIIGPG